MPVKTADLKTMKQSPSLDEVKTKENKKLNNKEKIIKCL